MQQSGYLIGSGRWLLVLGLIGVCGCKSRSVEVTIVNQGPALHVMEFDYPNASFGANSLASGAQFHYRIKVQGAGPVALQYEDASGHNRTAAGPAVDVGDQGSLLATVNSAGGVTWSTRLTNPR